jgi:hypothetical protein
MLLFFVIPAVIFMLWASVKLMGAALQPKPQDVYTKLEEIRTARSTGDRWQAAYALSQGLQKMIRDGEIEKLDPAKREELYKQLDELLKVHASDARLKRYLLLTLGQMGDPRGLTALEAGFDDKDAEVRFFSAWGFLDIMGKHPEQITEERLGKISQWLKSEDPALRKIGATFLVQQRKGAYIPEVEKLLKDEDREVRWNTAVALASLGVKSSAPVLKEVFDLKTLRDVGFKNFQDMQQLLLAAYGAAKKLNDPTVLAAATALKESVNPGNPEGRAIHGALK